MQENASYLSSCGKQSLTVSIVLTSLATFFLIKRMETSNDWMVVIALIFSILFMGVFTVEAFNGMGMHLQNRPSGYQFAFYNAALLCVKASILMQYSRVFPSQRMRHVCWIMLGVLVTYGSWAVISGFLNCIPVVRFWDPSTIGTLCVCVTSICRLLTLKRISNSPGPTYDNIPAATWSSIVCNTGIICACLPILRPLVSRIIPHLLSSLISSRHPNHRRISRGHIHDTHSPTHWGIPGMGMGVHTTITTRR
ncbi:hypothetical protein BJX99DRAFT_251652 [Aspergillus californicus]